MKPPKEKAKELVDRFTLVGLQMRNEGVKCALIAVDELINNPYTFKFLSQKEYWQEVKEEIENYD